jgi:hypothetical protein
VDTNIWFWTTYTHALFSDSPPLQYQQRFYPAYLSKARRNKAGLFRCGLTFAELAHRIEATEREIFERETGNQIGTKEFRHNFPHQRTHVASEVRTAREQVKTLAAPLDATIEDLLTDAALTRFNNQLLDGYDLFLPESASRKGLHQVLTDDIDFCTLPDITVFTANNLAISSARCQGKLRRR